MSASHAADPRLVRALRTQLARRRAALEAGAAHVGWKLGMGERERIGGQIAVGYLTSATVLAPGARIVTPPGELHADVEAAVQLAVSPDAIGRNGARCAADRPRNEQDPLDRARFGLALEIVDLAPQPDEPDSVIAGNVFHRAVAIAPLPGAPPPGTEARISVGGELRGSGGWPPDIAERVARAAAVLDAVDECFRAGDWIITGAMEQVPVQLGNAVVAELDDVVVGIELANGA